MTKDQAVQLYRDLHQLDALKGVKFAYGVARNIKLLEPEVKSIEEAMKNSPEFQAYEDLRVKLAKELANKDDNGVPIIENNVFVLDGNKEEFDKKLTALQKEHEPAIKARDTQLAELRKLLEEDSSVVLHKVNLSDVPEAISAVQLRTIMEMVEE